MALHLNIQDLLAARTVESDRIEFKEGWNPDAVYRSICAFTNNFETCIQPLVAINWLTMTLPQQAHQPQTTIPDHFERPIAAGIFRTQEQMSKQKG
ncbi:MAG: hypothetical protein SH848_00140 [Saprospiraceae bacterium]|nr:hypothetical protein [Saprospiraceae bacterium]MDZ4702304.1 hypothetical protein [Saprospiraceae bacterium]